MHGAAPSVTSIAKGGCTYWSSVEKGGVGEEDGREMGSFTLLGMGGGPGGWDFAESNVGVANYRRIRGGLSR